MNDNRTMKRFGWWTTGRDQAALDLFNEVQGAIARGVIPAEIAYCFCSRAPGEADVTDRLLERVSACGIPVVHLSAIGFEPGLRKSDRENWRNLYHHRVLGLLKDLRADLVILAGYMWVVSPEVCSSLPVINLHPAAPGGPAGTWQEVIWQLLENDASETGVMMHLVTPELDKGPALTCCTFSIKGPGWDDLWIDFRKMLSELGIEGIKGRYGEGQPLFRKVRQEGVKRELPLIVHTLRACALGKISVKDGVPCDEKGEPLEGPYDLTREIEEAVA